jgi:hypothetical protein
VSGIHVEVLHTETCATWRATAQRIRELAAGDALAVQLEVATIKTLDEAAERRFVGSPTVRVDGRDVQPEAERLEDFGLG